MKLAIAIFLFTHAATAAETLTCADAFRPAADIVIHAAAPLETWVSDIKGIDGDEHKATYAAEILARTPEREAVFADALRAPAKIRTHFLHDPLILRLASGDELRYEVAIPRHWRWLGPDLIPLETWWREGGVFNQSFASFRRGYDRDTLRVDVRIAEPTVGEDGKPRTLMSVMKITVYLVPGTSRVKYIILARLRVDRVDGEKVIKRTAIAPENPALKL